MPAVCSFAANYGVPHVGEVTGHRSLGLRSATKFLIQCLECEGKNDAARSGIKCDICNMTKAREAFTENCHCPACGHCPETQSVSMSSAVSEAAYASRKPRKCMQRAQDTYSQFCRSGRPVCENHRIIYSSIRGLLDSSMLRFIGSSIHSSLRRLIDSLSHPIIDSSTIQLAGTAQRPRV